MSAIRTPPTIKIPKRKALVRAKPEPEDEYVPTATVKIKQEHTSTIGELSFLEPDLPYLSHIEWSLEQLMEFVVHSALITVPSKPAHPHVKFFTCTTYTGETCTLPIRYRIPLLYCLQRIWNTIKYVLLNHHEIHPEHFQLLHLVRLVNELIRTSDEAMENGGVGSHWRCPPFDRMLLRFKHLCFSLDPETTTNFDSQFQSNSKTDLNARDVLLTNWKRWCMKAGTGLLVTAEEMDNGITCTEYASGLVFLNGHYAWHNSFPLESAMEHVRQTQIPQLPDSVPTFISRPRLPPLPRHSAKKAAAGTRKKAQPTLPSSALTKPPPPPLPRHSRKVPAPLVTPTSAPAPALPPAIQRESAVYRHNTFLDQLSLAFQPLLSEVSALRHDIRELRDSNMLYTSPVRPAMWTEQQKPGHDTMMREDS